MTVLSLTMSPFTVERKRSIEKDYSQRSDDIGRTFDIRIDRGKEEEGKKGLCLIWVNALVRVERRRKKNKRRRCRFMNLPVAVVIGSTDSTFKQSRCASMPATSKTRKTTILTSTAQTDVGMVAAAHEPSSFHGLSALLEAATSQLEYLANVATSQLTTVAAAAAAAATGHVDDDQADEDDSVNRDEEEEEDSSREANTNAKTDASGEATAETKRLVPSPKVAHVSLPLTAASTESNTFPQRLLRLCLDTANNADTITFLPDGKFFAVRKSSFARLLLSQVMSASQDESGGTSSDTYAFADFVKLTEQWGFSRIGNGEEESQPWNKAAFLANRHDILVFRHPNFIANEPERCRLIRYGDSPETVRMHALPSHNRINVNGLVASADIGSSQQQSKRRLSPGFLSRRGDDEEALSSTTRQRVDSEGEEQQDRRRPSEQSLSLGEENDLVLTDTSNTTPELRSVTKQRQRHSLPATFPREPIPTVNTLHDYYTNDHARTMALSITAERLKLTTQNTRRKSISHSNATTSTPAATAISSTTPTTTLVETAVTSCTHDIVTDAIESLLRDARHSKEMYRKHEKELSKSSLPGVIPVCKHIFAPSPKAKDKFKSGSHMRTRSDGGVPMQTSSLHNDEGASSLQTLARIVTQDQQHESDDHTDEDKTSGVITTTNRPLQQRQPFVVPTPGTSSEEIHRNRSGLQRPTMHTLTKPTLSPSELNLGTSESL